MPKVKKLSVESDGRRRFICVPAARAEDLHNYLRSNRVHSTPPAPSYTGFDNIELPGDADVNRIQALLNAWS